MNSHLSYLALLVCTVIFAGSLAAAEPDLATLQKQFADLPMEARRLTGPLFWLHGDETKEQLERELQKTVEGGNGVFTTEPRPHNDWLGEGWYRDLNICLQFAKKNDLKLVIYDDYWWPSQMMGGRVPPQFGSKMLQGAATTVEGPRAYTEAGYAGKEYIAAVAGKELPDGTVDGATLVDLAGSIRSGMLTWNAPAGKWKVMKFTWKFNGGSGMQRKYISVDGASSDCVEWFIKTVYQPHFDRFGADFGKTIVGYFYDEPETQGDWGSSVNTILAERSVDWKKAYVGWKFKLAGEEQTAANYQYRDAFAEAWGRGMYGGMARWCRDHKVYSTGHFMEHNECLFSTHLCAGNLFQLQKYSDMPGIDLVCRQFYPGQRKLGLWQMAKIGSSTAHVYDKADDIVMCEMFGAYGQDITYPQMKWLTDQMQVRGTNYMIPHSFNPRAPHDTDCPPYFYNGGQEPRWPLYRVYADYTSRLSLMLTGGKHVADIAVLFLGQSFHVGKKIRPDEMTDAIQDAVFDCDWMPYDAWEESKLEGKEIRLHKESYRVVVAPAAEVAPFPVMTKLKQFFDNGGIVIGYGMLPSRSATLGHSDSEIAELAKAIWGGNPAPGAAACKTSPAGGKSYFLSAKPLPEELRRVLNSAGIHSDLEVVKGQTDNWLHVLHRVRAGCDVFLVCNQLHTGEAKQFTFKVTATGVPSRWDAMRNEICAIPYKRINENTVELDLHLEPSESALLVFTPGKIAGLNEARLSGSGSSPSREIQIVREPVAAEPVAEPPKPAKETISLEGCSWVWYPEGNPASSAPAGVRYFRGEVSLPADRKVKSARFVITADNEATLMVNGKKAGQSDNSHEGWRNPRILDIGSLLRPGRNVLAVQAVNSTDEPSPAGLIGRYVVEFESGPAQSGAIDKSWKAAKSKQDGWEQPDFADANWAPVKVVAALGQKPWGKLDAPHHGKNRSRLTQSPVKGDLFTGRATIPADVNLAKSRLVLELDELAPEAAACITVNGSYAGGFIDKPFRLDVTKHLRAGENTIRIEPFAPKTAKLLVYDASK